MSYEEWLNNIEVLKETDCTEIKDKLVTEAENDNIKALLEPKLIDLIKYKFKKAIKKILYNLSEMYSDQNILDLNLVSLKKQLKFIIELTYIKQISEEKQEEIRISLKNEIQHIYDILIDEANKIDSIGLLNLIIKNNMYKWSDKNEL